MPSYYKNKFSDKYFIGRYVDSGGVSHRMNIGTNAVTGHRGYFYLNPTNRNQYTTITKEELGRDWSHPPTVSSDIPPNLKGKQIKSVKSGNIYTVTAQYDDGIMIDSDIPHVYARRITYGNLHARWEVL